MKLYKFYDWDETKGGKHITHFVIQYDNGHTFRMPLNERHWTSCQGGEEQIDFLVDQRRSWIYMMYNKVLKQEDILAESSELEYILVKGIEGLEEIQEIREREKISIFDWGD